MNAKEIEIRIELNEINSLNNDVTIYLWISSTLLTIGIVLVDFIS